MPMNTGDARVCQDLILDMGDVKNSRCRCFNIKLKAEELVMEKAEKFQEAVVKLWLAEIKKLNISKEKICQIKDTTNKSLDL